MLGTATRRSFSSASGAGPGEALVVGRTGVRRRCRPGIRVNAIAPGPTLTDIAQAHRDLLDPLIATLPSRGYSTPAQIGATAVFLASDDAANIHGAIIPVDGGFTAI